MWLCIFLIQLFIVRCSYLLTNDLCSWKIFEVFWKIVYLYQVVEFFNSLVSHVIDSLFKIRCELMYAEPSLFLKLEFNGYYEFLFKTN